MAMEGIVIFAKWKARLGKIAGRVRPASAWGGFRWGAALALIALLLAAIGLSIWTWFPEAWGWLSEKNSGESVESNSTTLRNAGLVVAGIIALGFAVWRGYIAHKQASTAQQSLLNERYQKGAEMLGSETISVRLGGIYALQRLAEEYPKQYYIQVMKLMCSFVRLPPELGENSFGVVISTESLSDLRDDIQYALEAIVKCRQKGFHLEDENPRWNLTFAKLRGAILTGANLSKFDLSGADLRSAYLMGANLDLANLQSTDLCKAYLNNATFNNANLSNTVL